MRLTELDPSFITLSRNEPGEPNGSFWHRGDIATCDGLWLCCPKCYLTKGNSLIGVHGIICWKPQVPQTIRPTPGRWSMQGTGLDDLTLVAGSSSVSLDDAQGCRAHFFIRNGEIVMCE